MATIKEGRYHHHKGGIYDLLFLAQTHNHNGDMDVVYFSIMRQEYKTRPMSRDTRDEDAWTDVIPWPDGKERQRFMHATEISPEELGACLEARSTKVDWNEEKKVWEPKS